MDADFVREALGFWVDTKEKLVVQDATSIFEDGVVLRRATLHEVKMWNLLTTPQTQWGEDPTEARM